MASRAGPSANEEKLAREVLKLAHSELNNDVQEVMQDLGSITEEVKQIRSSISTFASGTIGTLKPVISLLTKAAKRPRTQPAGASREM